MISGVKNSSERHDAAVRPALARMTLLVLLSGIALMMFGAGQAQALPFQPGLVEIDGYGWSVDPIPVDLNNQTGGTTGTPLGETAPVEVFTLHQILTTVGKTAEFDLQTLPEVEIAIPGRRQPFTCSGDNIRANTKCGQLVRFFVGSDQFTKLLLPGETQPASYEEVNAKIYNPTTPPKLTASLTPISKKVKSGESATFKASVTGSKGSAVTYQWSVDGVTRQTSGKPSFSYTFRGKDKRFSVVLIASASGFKDGQASSLITIGKVPPKPKPKPEDKNDENTTPNTGTGTGTGGYGTGYGGYGSGYPGGTGNYQGSTGTTPSPPAPSPTPPKPKPPEPPVDDGLIPITGELVSSTAPAATVSPGDPGAAAVLDPPTPDPEADSAGFGLPKETWTVVGILALFGFGMVAERRSSRLG